MQNVGSGPVFISIMLCLSGAANAQQGGEDPVLFGDLPKVEAAALHAQTLAEAPANVSIVTAADIRHYGYRTLAEVLSAVRGFYVTYDRLYHYAGVSGISLPGDFNTRFLVMLNGHPLTDNIYNSNGFYGQDFGLDMDLVERIEIIRGPTSALYGSNGMLANINVVTRSPVDGEKLRVSAENGSFGERKASISSSMYLGRGANAVVAASVFNNAGEGPADGERGYHTFANVIWRNWSVTAYFNSRDKQPPIGLGASLSADPSQHVVDGRSLVGVSYKRHAGPGQLQWQMYYDRYRYRDRYDYPESQGIDVLQDVNRGDTLDTQLTYALPVTSAGLLTVGVQGQWDLRAEQYNLDDGALQFYANHPDRDAALFAQQEWSLSVRWKLYGGVRLEESRNYGHFISPRMAAVYQRSTRTVYKLVYGRPFRNPSAFEQSYNDGGLSYAAAPALQHEAAQTFQASLERTVAKAWTLTLDGFHYRIGEAIEAVNLASGAQQYQNTGVLYSTGAEAELSGKLWQRVQVSASAVWQRANGNGNSWLPNSPRQLFKTRWGVPLFSDRLFLSAAMQVISARRTWSGSSLGGTAIDDFTATWRLHPRCDIVAGVRNAFDSHYEDPVFLTVDHVRVDGRTAFLKLVWRIWE
jgi:outer membrane receptor for ferrienterochelin and colicins